MVRRVKTAVLISGGGSNLQSLIDHCAAPDYPAEICLVISNKADAYGLERAKNAAIPTLVIAHQDYQNREKFEAALHAALEDVGTELVCLAGFMRILGAEFVEKWRDKMLNIHPSLLPAYKGLHTHQRAIDAGDKLAGCTVHYVTPELDSGDIILQAEVPVFPDDTAEKLAERVLVEEHRLYPTALKMLADKLLDLV